MNIEEAFLDKIWLVVNDGLPEGELMLSGNDQDKVEQILKEYHQAKLKNLALSGVVSSAFAKELYKQINENKKDHKDNNSPQMYIDDVFEMVEETEKLINSKFI